MNVLVPIALFGWIPITLLIFSVFPPRRAATIAFVAGWLFLPYTGYEIPGLPDYSKLTATSLGALLATVLFRSDSLFALRPRWSDLPMAVWCLCPIASSLSNGLGLYDGLSASLSNFISWGLPYLIGRIYFTRLEHLRELATGIVIGGLAYVPFCVWELRMSPQLHDHVYGISRGWGEVVFGGYRPKVFMSCALELGLWMTAASTTGLWLWSSGTIKNIYNIKFLNLLIVLLIITILCKVAGAWLILILGIALWYLTKWTESRLPAIILVLVPILYMATRTTGVWTGEGAVNLVRMVLNDRRAGSLGFRMFNEDMLMAKALRQPMFGWGGWNRAGVESEDGRVISIYDGMWIIILGNHGLVGLISFNLALLLPMLLLIGRYPPRVWRLPALAPTAVLAAIASLYTIDCIANAMINPVYMLILGGVTGALGARDPRASSHAELQGGFSDGINNPGPSILGEHADGVHAYEQRVSMDSREDAAIRLSLLGRSLMERGLMQEAEEAWLSASQSWADLSVDHPDEPAYRKCWLDCLNDQAWSLITLAGSDPRHLSRAVQLSEQSVGSDPENATYWNTLGTAYFRMGDWRAAVRALERSTELGAGGTSFDYFFLAMAHAKLGDSAQAQHWYSLADHWMNEHNPDHEGLLRFRAEARSLIAPPTASRVKMTL